MNLDAIGNALLIIVLIGWLGYRQTTWRAVSPGRMWRTPAIMAVVGIALMAQTSVALEPLDVAVMVIELGISLGVGAWMGAIARFRPYRGGESATDGTTPAYESRTGWWGLALWLIVLITRIVIDVVASGMGAHAATSMGVILLLFAANRAARTAVILARVDRGAAVTA